MATQPELELPNELWLAIIDILPRKDLPNLSLVSKAIHELTEPTLYSQLDTHKCLQGPDISLACFFRTVVHNPKLALHVKHANLRAMHSNPRFSHGIDTIDTSFLDEKGRSVIKEQISQSLVDEDDKDHWCRTISLDQNWDAVAAYILLASSNIVSLTVMNVGAPARWYYIPTHLACAGTMSKLQSVHLHQDTSSRDANFFRVVRSLPFLNVESVTTVHAHGMSDTSFTSAGQTCATNSLTLVNCSLTDSALKDFLGVFTALKKLV